MINGIECSGEAKSASERGYPYAALLIATRFQHEWAQVVIGFDDMRILVVNLNLSCECLARFADRFLSLYFHRHFLFQKIYKFLLRGVIYYISRS